MPIAVWTSLLIFVFVNAITPGPGNILALNTVTNYGWQRGKPLFYGIFAGYYGIHLFCALFVYGISEVLPNLLDVMKYVGAAYIVYLAIRMAMTKPSFASTDKEASFMQGFLLQLVNVKKLAFGSTALTGYVIGYYHTLTAFILIELLIAAIGVLCTSVWIIAGAVLQKYYLRYGRVLNAIMALILLRSAWMMIH